MTEIGVSVLATKATTFFQLLVLSYHGAETPGMRKGALYFALDANMQPPAALKEFEVESARLPPLKDVLGSGASASVYKVLICRSL